jgi:hypothetical protein
MLRIGEHITALAAPAFIKADGTAEKQTLTLGRLILYLQIGLRFLSCSPFLYLRARLLPYGQLFDVSMKGKGLTTDN